MSDPRINHRIHEIADKVDQDTEICIHRRFFCERIHLLHYVVKRLVICVTGNILRLNTVCKNLGRELLDLACFLCPFLFKGGFYLSGFSITNRLQIDLVLLLE